MRLGEKGDDNLVDALAGGRIDQLAKVRPVSFQFGGMPQAQHGPYDGTRLRTGKTDNTYAASSGRCGNGDDGIVEIHRFILRNLTA